jgi:TRAP transporter TAXI family solute receptor
MTGIGSIGNTLHTGNGKSDIGLSYGTFLKLARQGGNELFPEPIKEDVRAVMSLTRNTLHLILDAKMDPDLSKLKQAKTKLRVATGNVGSSELFSTGKLLDAYGITFKDIESWGGRIDRLQTGGRADAWKNRQADLVVFFIQVGSPAILEALTLRKSNLVNIQKSVQDEMIEKFGYMKDTIPANSYKGQTQDLETLGLPFIVFCNAAVDAEIIYDMTKQVAENKERMIQAGAAFKHWNPEDMVSGLGIEIHEGALRYYKERGWIK